jgi:hypothetical protein
MPLRRDIADQVAANEKRKIWPPIVVVAATALSIPALFTGYLVTALVLVVAGVAIGILVRRRIGVRCPSCNRMIRMYDAGTDYLKLQSLQQCAHCGATLAA